MSNFQTIQVNARSLTRAKVKKDLFDFIRLLEDELVAYNRATLNQDSEDIFGKPIGFYSTATEILSGGKKKDGEPFDLLDTGDFLEGLFAKVGKESIFFDTTDSKKNKVFKKLLSDNIFGLQDEDLNTVLEKRVQPFLVDYFTQNLLK